jgi:5-methylcytosine-specific restriction endonuclease McrA
MLECPREITLHHLSDDRLLEDLHALVRKSCQVGAEMLIHLAEVDARRLYLGRACSSMFAYCTEVLGMDEGTAYKRIRAARAARELPVLFEWLAGGRIHLAGIVLLAPHLTPENHLELLSEAAGKSKRQIEELVAGRFPQPDAPTRIRKLPAPRQEAPALREVVPAGPGAPARGNGGSVHSESSLFEAATGSAPTDAAPPPDKEGSALPRTATAPPPAAVRPSTPELRQIEPLSAERYRVQFTADRALHDKLRNVQALVRNKIPSGDVAAVCEMALDLLLESLLKKKFAVTRKAGASQTGRVRSERASKPSRHIPNAVKREVFRRDEGRCTFLDDQGRRCTARAFLELHHRQAFGRGGPHTAENIALACSAHNLHEARREYGSELLEARRRERRGRLRVNPTPCVGGTVPGARDPTHLG